MAVRGKVVSFDRIKGYGFVASDAGGDDVFVHVNDLLDDKSLMTPGCIVEFVVEEGDRGPKASEVTVIRPAGGGAPRSVGTTAGPFHSPADSSDGEDLCDVLSVAEFEREITETLLHAGPTLTGAQILDLRERIVRLGQSHGWVDR